MMTAALSTKADVVIEIFYSGAWHIVPVYARDSISIVGAVPNFATVASPASATLSIQNTSDLYSPLNPAGALFGLIGLNTPIRISVDGSVEFVGEIETWAPDFTTRIGVDAWVAVTAYGILRRLNRPGTQAPELSPLRRAYRAGGTLDDGLLVYLPLEEGPTAAGAEFAAGGLTALTPANGVTLGTAREVQNGSLPYAVLDGDAASAQVAAFADINPLPSSTAGFYGFGATFKGSMLRPSTAKAVIYRGMRQWFSGGDITDAQVIVYAKWTGTAFDSTNTGVDVVLTGGTSFGSVVGAVDTFNLFDGNPHDIQVRLDQSGADVVGQLWIDGVLADEATSSTKTLGTPNIFGFPYVSTGSLGGTTADMTDTTLAFGHFAISTSDALGVLHDAATGYVGERSADRIERLFTEDGVPITIVGDPAESPVMGPQVPGSLMTLVGYCVDVGQGILFDTRDALGVTYRTIGDLYNQSSAIDLVFNHGGHIAPPFKPANDTEPIMNDVTVTRFQGASAQIVQETGPRNVQEPTADPDGVGRYPKAFRLFVGDDTQNATQASRRVHVGTYPDPRYPSIVFDLSAMVADGLTSLKAAALALGVGDRLTIANVPKSSAPDVVDQLAMGYSHTIDSHHWTKRVNAAPSGPYEAWEIESTVGNRGRLSPAATTLDEALTTTETLCDIVSAAVRWIDSATYPTMFPFDIVIDGERMTVTEVTGTTLSQTMRCLRSVNGVVKTHAAGAPVKLYRPPVVAL